MRKLSMDELGRPSAEAFKNAEKLPLVLVLDSLRSLHNVGAMFRTADAFAIERILLCGFTGTPPHREIHKTALGSEETVAWAHALDVGQALAELKAAGYQVLALEQTDASLPLERAPVQPGRPVALVVGNEVHGVGEAGLAHCDAAVEIPQHGTKHSLNVAVAAGIALYALSLRLRGGH